MIRRLELIGHLEGLRDAEEKGSNLMASVMKNWLADADITSGERGWLMSEVFDILDKETKEHTEYLDELIANLRRDNRDAL